MRVGGSPNVPSRQSKQTIPISNKTKTKRMPKSGTGVAAAMSLYGHPQSTNVSSPIHGDSRSRKAPRNAFIDDEAEDGGYGSESFINEYSDDDGFAPVRQSGKRPVKAQLGPPITNDPRMAEVQVSDVHRAVIDQFVEEAKRLEETIRNQKGIRGNFFNEEHYREMGLNWTTTIEEMRRIPRINVARVDEYGARFIPLITRYYRHCEDMMGRNEDRDLDRSHRNVINLVSDNEDGEVEEEDDDDGDEDEESGHEGPSKFFANTNGTQIPPRRAIRASTYSRGGGSRGGTSRSNFTANSKPKRTNSFKKRGAIQKKRSSAGKRSSYGSSTSVSGSNTFKKYSRKDGSRRGGGGGGSEFSMMPTN